MSTSSSQPREWEILPLAGSTAEDFTANEPLPPQTTAKAKAARHFFSDKLLYQEVQPGCPPRPQLESSSQPVPLNPLGSTGRGLREQPRPVLQAGAHKHFLPALPQRGSATAASYLPGEHRLCHAHLGMHRLPLIS